MSSSFQHWTKENKNNHWLHYLANSLSLTGQKRGKETSLCLIQLLMGFHAIRTILKTISFAMKLLLITTFRQRSIAVMFMSRPTTHGPLRPTEKGWTLGRPAGLFFCF